MKCARPNCRNAARINALGSLKNRGLCDKHYVAAERGYVDGDPVRRHLAHLNQAGYSWRQLAELTGKSEFGLTLIRDGHRRVHVATARAVFAIPRPDLYAGAGLVDATGIHRRIWALAAMGWPLRELERRLNMCHRGMSSNVLRRKRIRAAKARRIVALYDELAWQPGPSDATRKLAARKGWPPPLAWDDIDNPDESPTLGESRAVSFPERYAELRYHLGLSDEQIAERHGIKLDSLQTQLRRYGLSDRRTA